VIDRHARSADPPSSHGTASATAPLVSIVVPVYDGERYICDAIASAVGQTYARTEIIVVDDGSKEPIAPRLSRWADRLQIHRTPNRGVAAARNFGIRHSTGDYVALLDQDDVWRPDKLERQMEILCARPEVGLIHSDILFRDERQGRTYHEERPRASLSGHCYATLFGGCQIATCTVVMPRSVLETVGMFDEDIRGTDDYDLVLRVARHFPLAYLDEPLATYRVHDTNWSHRSLDMLRGELRVVEKAITQDGELDRRVGATAVRARQADLLCAVGYELLHGRNRAEARGPLARSLRLDFRTQAAIWYASTFVPQSLLAPLRRFKQAQFGQARQGT
jgi:glycosyltransferase involved in cell wall biosynthesis